MLPTQLHTDRMVQLYRIRPWWSNAGPWSLEWPGKAPWEGGGPAMEEAWLRILGIIRCGPIGPTWVWTWTPRKKNKIITIIYVYIIIS